MTVLRLSGDEYPLADYCPVGYFQGREAFLKAASDNPAVSIIDSLKIHAQGPNESPLFIDVAVLGDLQSAQKVIFHISGTHGAEGGSGSGIQHYFLSQFHTVSNDQAIVFIHALNPFGMAWNRRVNENNVDLNRNCVQSRLSSPLCTIIDPLINPKEVIPFNEEKYQNLCEQFGKTEVRAAILQGQYDFPEGLFFGGYEIEEGPRLVLRWCEDQLLKLEKNLQDMKIGIIDVHTGLGPFAYDTLITLEPPSDLMCEIFGEKMNVAKQMATVGYQATGVFVKRLKDRLIEISKCDSSHICVIGQEFGTVDENQVISALYTENMHYHWAKRHKIPYDPEEEIGSIMLKTFYPEEKEWRHQIVLSGHELIDKLFILLKE